MCTIIVLIKKNRARHWGAGLAFQHREAGGSLGVPVSLGCTARPSLRTKISAEGDVLLPPPLESAIASRLPKVHMCSSGDTSNPGTPLLPQGSQFRGSPYCAALSHRPSLAAAGVLSQAVPRMQGAPHP